MKYKLTVLLGALIIFNSFAIQDDRFNPEKDFLLANFDCKTDVDDLHAAAALITLMSHSDYSNINYHAVAGAYGVQEGLYVPPNELFELAFPEDRWSDAHTDWDQAVNRVSKIARETLSQGGDIWIADGGQSDFSASIIQRMNKELPDVNTSNRIHVVQHSDWNEEVTSKEALNIVKESGDYIRIPDGNAVGNGTPGFRTPGFMGWKDISDSDLLKIWSLAVKLGLKYNAADGRYNNEAVGANGVDFSDLSETCWILGIEDIKDSKEFFDRFTD